jgi:hypothetical protein
MRRLVATFSLALAACGSTPAAPPNTVGGYPLLPVDISYAEGTCSNGLSCLVVTASDTANACALQQLNHSSNAFYANSTFAVFELYASTGVPTPIPSGTYPVYRQGSTLGGGPAALVTFYKLDSNCAAAFQGYATTGSVTLGSTGTVIDYQVGFDVLGSLSATGVAAALCNVNPDTGTHYCI